MLLAVVGPSGAGKDTLLDGARRELAGEPDIHFARRVITRDGAAGGEAHEAMSRAGFEVARDAGDFALWWSAHGLLYGLRAEIVGIIAQRRLVVANLSRRVLSEASEALPVLVVEVTASPAVLAARLAARGRETEEGIGARLERMAAIPPGLPVKTIVNDGSLEDGVARMTQAIREALHATRSGALPG
jgi:ribose 1,5-bisphosphokinase